MNNININKLITDNTNIIEVYLKSHNLSNNKLDITLDKNKVERILSKYKFKSDVNYSQYNKNNLILLYDLSNDCQLVIEKDLENYKELNKNIIFCYNEKKLPPYLFGCDNMIDNNTKYKIKEFKVNNRISIIYKIENEKESVFIQYKHDKHVDLEKNEYIINDILKNII
tara:strand:- start:3535 stop:4041 length:507 start_codon:yes stop_codon:yes gene_type:complete